MAERNSQINPLIRNLKAPKPLKVVTQNGGTNTVTPSSALEAVPSVKTQVLPENSQELIKITHYENGPRLFFVQLQKLEQDFYKMNMALQKIELHNLNRKPVPRMACLARYTDNKVYRAVISHIVSAKECCVSYVDYGNKGNVKFEYIYQIPPLYLQLKTFALSFALSGLKDTSKILSDDEVNFYFKKSTAGTLKLKVVPLEGPPISQYCELYDDRGASVIDVLKKWNPYELSFKVPRKLDHVPYNVTVCYVESATEFFVRRNESNITMNYNTMSDLLQEYSSNAPKLRPQNIRVGTICVGNVMGEWHRCVVLKVRDHNMCRVNLIDFGVQEEMSSKELKALVNNLIEHPPFAYKCCLRGLEECTSNNIATQFEIFCNDPRKERKVFKMTIVETRTEDYLVELEDFSVSPTTNVSEMLLKFNRPLLETMQIENARRPNQTGTSRNNRQQNTKSGDWSGQKFNGPEVSSTPLKKNPIHLDKINDTNNNNNNHINNINNNNNNNRDQVKSRDTRNSPEKKSRSNNNNNTNANVKSDKRQEKSMSPAENTLESTKRTPVKSLGKQQQQHDKSDWESIQPSPAKRLNETSLDSNGNLLSNKSQISPDSDRSIDSTKKQKNRKQNHNNTDWTTLQDSPKSINESHESSVNDSMFSSSLASSASGKEQNKRKVNNERQNAAKETVVTKPQNKQNKIIDSSTGNSSSTSSNCIKELVPFNTIYKTSNIKSKIDYNVNFVSWISPYEFYVRMKNDKDAFDLQTEELEQSYKNDVPLNVNVKLEKYNMVAACSNGQYYRGEVIDVIENGRKFLIGCVDTGEVKVLSHKDLYKMEKHFTLNARLCVKCSFDNVLCNGFYSSDSIHKILDNTKMYTISFQDNSFSSDHSHLPSNVVQKFEIGNKNARNLLIQCKVIKEVPDNFDIHFLKDQIIRFNIVAVGESDELLCQPENSDLMFLASLPTKLENEQLKVFKTKYEGQQLVAKIHDVFEFNNKLNITPYIDMFTKEPAPQTTVPILNKVFTGWISHIQSLNCAYFHLKEWHEEFPKRLEILFAFYEENNRPALRQYKKGTLCAGKSKDGNWYRCQIVSDQVQKGLCEVQYLDYGNTEFIVAETLMELDQRFIDNSNLAIKIFYAISNTKKCNVKDLITEMKELIADEVECNVEEFYDGGVIVDVIHTRSNKNLFQNLINQEMAANVSIDELKNDLIESIHMNSADEDTKVDCEIAAFTSPTDFYIRPESLVSKYEQMKQDIQLIAQAIKPLSCFDENTLCLACDPYNHEWHRAKIIDSDGEIITVRCTDSGFTYTLVDKHDLKQLPQELAKFQPFAIRCSLAIKLNPKYEECATNEMKEFIAKKMKFKFEFITDVCTKFVDLYCDDLNLAEEFVKQKYAQLMEVVPAGKCYISHVNSLLDFYIQLEKDTLLLQHISDYLADNVKKLLPMEDFKEGSMCAAMYPEDSEWYRAVIEYHNENGTGVKFIDFGNDCFVQKVCAISDEITAIPPMAKKVCIMKPPMIQEYSVEAEEKFQEIAALGETVMDVKMIAPGEFASVELRIEGKNINDTLTPLCQINDQPESLTYNFDDTNESALKVDMEDCFITHVTSPRDFYVNYEKNSGSFELIKTFLSKHASKMPVLDDRTIGNQCVGLFPEDGEFYRCKILSNATDGCDVLFIDYGSTSFVTDLRVLPNELQSLNPMAVHCSLDQKIIFTAKGEKDLLEMFGTADVAFKIHILNDNDCDPKECQIYRISDKGNHENVTDILECEYSTSLEYDHSISSNSVLI